MTSGITGLFLSLAMLAVFALAAGGAWMIARRRDRRRGMLMLVMAAVLLGNVLIIAWPAGRRSPTPSPQPGAAPVNEQGNQRESDRRMSR